ncbi:hypothetical protein RU92_GL000459 [Lactococcus cremoris subsp. tructae]|uniref:Uncharacterized protein n=1 Tax=Lactococcus cremoris subsp. tructae TaxID=542833 RepID=A0A2A5SY46_LACLC|nr:hypothetical protein RU92_GL000459 [Lactococcus cremoris subsp. tructae]
MFPPNENGLFYTLLILRNRLLFVKEKNITFWLLENWFIPTVERIL